MNFGKVLHNGRNSCGMSVNAIYYATHGKFPPKPEPVAPWNSRIMPQGVKFAINKKVQP